MSIPTSNIDMDQLRTLIGTRVEIEGTVCEIIEVLEDGPSLILQDCEKHPIIQADQYGEAHRRVPTTRTVPILCPDQHDWNPTFLGLNLLGDIPTSQNKSKIN